MGVLSKLLPTQGLYCVAIKNPTGPGFKHRFQTSVGEAEAAIRACDAAGQTVYIAQASFVTGESRKQENVHRVRSYWFDIDCGPEAFEKNPNAAYETKSAGANALGLFLEVTGLPRPAITDSGNGLYAHWYMTEDLLPDQWREVAYILKKLCDMHGFKVDPSRTADHASVLRPVGSTNRKHGAEKTVTLLRDCEPIEFTQFAGYIRDAAKRVKIKTDALEPPPVFQSADEFTSGIDNGNGPPPSAVKMSEHCAQFAYLRDKQGDVPEPLWYAAIGVLRYCEEGRPLIHEWSKGHAEYDYDATERKIQQHEDKKIPPTTCHTFGSINGSTCTGCKHASKIKTPIVLGRTLKEVTATEVADDRLEMPHGYVLTTEGLFYDSDGDQIRFYPHDVYPRLVANDASTGTEVVVFRHHLPFEGWQEFSLRSGLIRDQRAFLMALQDNHVGVDGKTESNLMSDYLQRYVNKLRSGRKLARLYNQMGWKQLEGELAFVLGDRLISKTGIERVGLGRNVPEISKAFTTNGNLQDWVDATELINPWPDLCFGFLCGFAAPLMQFAGYEGATVAMIGESGIGKTLITRYAQSIFGYFPELMMSQEDTKNALVSRLGIYGSLPFTIDEVSNIDPMELSDLVYRITQGRDKARLTKNAVEKTGNNQWRTIAIVSSNHSLIDRLSMAKTDAAAEMNRVFEYTVEKDPARTKEIMTHIHRTCLANYGLAGEVYIKYLVDNQEKHADNIEKIMADIDRQTGALTEERFISAVVACVVYAGVIAHKLGLVKIDIAAVKAWAIKTVRANRTVKEDFVVDAVGMLGQFIDRHQSGIIGLGNTDNKTGASVDREPHGAIHIRYEIDHQRMYISRDALKQHLQKTFGSYAKMRTDLERIGALKKHDARKVLGANALGYGGASQYVWEIDLTCPALGNVLVVLNERPAKIDEVRKVIPIRG